MKKIISCYTLLLFSVLIFISAYPVYSQDETVIKGIITEDVQLITDEGDVYDISENDLSSKLSKNINKKVEIKGIVMTDEDTGCKYITASSFKLTEEMDANGGQ